MSVKLVKKKFSAGTIGIWAIFFITTIVMAALVIGEIFSSSEFWIPMIPIGVLLVLAIMATVVDLRTEKKVKVGIIGVWTIFLITTVVMAALIGGKVFSSSEYWIPIIPIGTLFILAIIPTISEYITGEIKFCPKCGKKFEKKWEFCQECGARVLIACPSCGMKIKGNPKFCHKCGTNLSEVEIEQIFRPPAKSKVRNQANFCHNCGGPANPEAKFCGFCGAAQK
ncbi:MAG: zinc ribbon domain-containing protein [Promethearchaeota archaeon]